MAARVDIACCDRNDADDAAEKRRDDEAAAVFQAFGDCCCSVMLCGGERVRPPSVLMIRCPSMTTNCTCCVRIGCERRKCE
jgi:hypothetical protein